MSYHISKNGEPAQCHAYKRPCPLGGSEDHYNTITEAQEAIDSKMSNKVNAQGLSKKFSKIEDIKKYENGIGYEVYNHPNGSKIVVSDELVYAFNKKGEAKEMKVTPKQLRKGYGKWENEKLDPRYSDPDEESIYAVNLEDMMNSHPNNTVAAVMQRARQ